MHREETKLKVSKALSAKEKTSEHKSNISKSLLGKTKSAYKLKEGRIYTKDRKAENIECVHCGKNGSAFGMKRWHFDNCRMKPV